MTYTHHNKQNTVGMRKVDFSNRPTATIGRRYYRELGKFLDLCDNNTLIFTVIDGNLIVGTEETSIVVAPCEDEPTPNPFFVKLAKLVFKLKRV